MKRIPLSQGQFAFIDDIDEDKVSLLRWFSKWNGHTKSFYAKSNSLRAASGKSVAMHRYITNATNGQIVDHINHNTLDNTRSNLRVCSSLGNAQNARLRSDNTSGYKGVSWSNRDKRWAPHISVDGKVICLGHYRDLIEAAMVYDNAAIRYHGEFAMTNKKLGLL